jgi:hypothetical protein
LLVKAGRSYRDGRGEYDLPGRRIVFAGTFSGGHLAPQSDCWYCAYYREISRKEWGCWSIERPQLSLDRVILANSRNTDAEVVQRQRKETAYNKNR